MGFARVPNFEGKMKLCSCAPDRDRGSYKKSTLAGYDSLYTPWMKKQVWNGRKGGEMQDDHVSHFCGKQSTGGSICSYYFFDLLVLLSTSGSFYFHCFTGTVAVWGEGFCW